MDIILLFTVTAAILVTIGLLGLYINVTARIKNIERDMKAHRAELSNHKSRLKVIEERAAQESDRIVITHEWKEAGDIRYPSQEV